MTAVKLSKRAMALLVEVAYGRCRLWPGDALPSAWLVLERAGLVERSGEDRAALTPAGAEMLTGKLDPQKVDAAGIAILRGNECRRDAAALCQRATRHAAANPNAHRETAAALAVLLGIIGAAEEMELLP